MSIYILEASSKDLASLGELEREHTNVTPLTESSLLLEIRAPGTIILVAKAEDKGLEVVIGYLLLSRQAVSVHVKRLLVSKDWRRQNVATRLILQVVEMAKRRKASTISLFVEVTNQAARALYQKVGFVDEVVVEDYYAKGRCAVRMALDLSSDAIEDANGQGPALQQHYESKTGPT